MPNCKYATGNERKRKKTSQWDSKGSILTPETCFEYLNTEHGIFQW